MVFATLGQGVDGPPEANAAEIAGEDDMARLPGTFATELVACRIRLCLWWLRGWPTRLAMAETLPGPTLVSFKRDYQNWESICNQADAKDIWERSPFQLAAVRQIAEVLKANNWQWTDELLALLARRSRRIFGTQLIEDGFKRLVSTSAQRQSFVDRGTMIYPCIPQTHSEDTRHTTSTTYIWNYEDIRGLLA